MKGRVVIATRFWLARYGPQDLAAAAASVLGAVVLGGLTQSAAVVAFSAAALEWSVFYGVALVRSREAGEHLRAAATRIVREYGPAEVLDLVVRPGLMHGGLLLLPAPALGVLAGGLLADVVFYVFASRASGRYPAGAQRHSRSRAPADGTGFAHVAPTSPAKTAD